MHSAPVCSAYTSAQPWPKGPRTPSASVLESSQRLVQARSLRRMRERSSKNLIWRCTDVRIYSGVCTLVGSCHAACSARHLVVLCAIVPHDVQAYETQSVPVIVRSKSKPLLKLNTKASDSPELILAAKPPPATLPACKHMHMQLLGCNFQQIATELDAQTAEVDIRNQ